MHNKNPPLYSEIKRIRCIFNFLTYHYCYNRNSISENFLTLLKLPDETQIGWIYPHSYNASVHLIFGSVIAFI